MASDASHALEAALEQMDGIIADLPKRTKPLAKSPVSGRTVWLDPRGPGSTGTKTGADISDGTCEPGLASPASCMSSFPVLHLVEDLRLALETLEHPQERAALLSQIPGPTAAYIKEWFGESLDMAAMVKQLLAPKPKKKNNCVVHSGREVVLLSGRRSTSSRGMITMLVHVSEKDRPQRTKCMGV
ncbi:liprin-beta-2-like [Talpa occidentalis]|uniref:liprin-beta-2-like n=1 Tax=Talpa occidentalis TaxID=50954 RepID=UPI0023F88FE1|nr:liprin-beta-2-like [Talpa occidentalis]